MTWEDFLVAPQIILVEDDDLDAMALERALGREGPTDIIRFRTAEAALQAMQAAPHGETVYIVDIDLPGMSGLDLLEAVRSSSDERLRRHTFFVLTGQDCPAKRQRAYDHHAAGYALKDPAERDADAELARFAHLIHSYLVVCRST